MVYALVMLGNYGYRHTLRIFNSYCWYTVKVVMRKRPIVKLYIYFLSCLLSPVVISIPL